MCQCLLMDWKGALCNLITEQSSKDEKRYAHAFISFIAFMSKNSLLLVASMHDEGTICREQARGNECI